jgi:hypothetical protein
MIKGYESVASQPAWKGMRHMDLHPAHAVLPDKTIMAGNVLRRNILYYHDPDARLFRFGRVNFDYNTSDYNLVYHFGRALATGCSALKAKAVQGPNLAPNPGFEAGTVGQLPQAWHWQIRPTPSAVALMDPSARTGKAALRINGCAGTDRQGKPAWPILRSGEIPARHGQTYRLTAWMRSETPGTKAMLGAQAWKKDTYSWSQEVPLVVGAEWKQYECVIQFPAEGQRRYHPQMKGFYVRLDLVQPGGTLWVDDVCLQEAVAEDEWEAWRRMGQDQHSLVADPRFVDPAKDDYRLRADSPAFQLGFQPIPVEKIGPYQDPLRASWPIVEAEGAREKPLVSER